jgi:FkbM family methyltransferase
LIRFYRITLHIPFEEDFNALPLFPDFRETLFLDVGANRGQSTDAILMKTNNARIHLFEPNQYLCEKLKHLFYKNKRITLHDFALGDQNKEDVLYIPFYKKWMFDGLASFHREAAEKWLKNRIFFYDERYLSLQKMECKIRPLDELKLDPYFIKIDVQGLAFEVLKGGVQTLKKYEPILLVESPNKEMVNYLKSFGYQYYAFKKGKFILNVKGRLNTFFMTPKKSALVRNYIEKA